MAIPAGVSRIVLSGTLYGGEVFQTGFFIDAQMADDPAAQASAVAYASAFTANLATVLCPYLTTDSAYKNVNVYSYNDASGHATHLGQAPITGGTGQGAAGTLPNQCCMVASLLTGNAGRRNRGRMYLPTNANTLTTHEFNLGSCTNVANALKAFWNSQAVKPVVVSQAGSSKKLVTQVRIDTRVDIQRRRANKQSVLGTTTITL